MLSSAEKAEQPWAADPVDPKKVVWCTKMSVRSFGSLNFAHFASCVLLELYSFRTTRSAREELCPIATLSPLAQWEELHCDLASPSQGLNA
jgi:hypothetical protein